VTRTHILSVNLESFGPLICDLYSTLLTSHNTDIFQQTVKTSLLAGTYIFANYRTLKIFFRTTSCLLLRSDSSRWSDNFQHASTLRNMIVSTHLRGALINVEEHCLALRHQMLTWNSEAILQKLPRLNAPLNAGRAADLSQMYINYITILHEIFCCSINITNLTMVQNVNIMFRPFQTQ
jgi:hypothetical protein